MEPAELTDEYISDALAHIEKAVDKSPARFAKALEKIQSNELLVKQIPASVVLGFVKKLAECIDATLDGAPILSVWGQQILRVHVHQLAASPAGQAAAQALLSAVERRLALRDALDTCVGRMSALFTAPSAPSAPSE